jgi:hypothetical protein
VPLLAEEFDALVACRPDLIADPYPFYRRLREQAPVYRHADQVAVSTFDDVARVLLDSSTFQNGHAGLRGSRVRANLGAASLEQRRKMIEILEFRGSGLNHLKGGAARAAADPGAQSVHPAPDQGARGSHPGDR